jgi:toxin-antitoxin system PIN domain toxin
MAQALLDTSVLIALCDPSHSMHGAALGWLGQVTGGVATCPIVENGAVRILSQPKYASGTPISTSSAVFAVREIRNVTGYEFWADDLSLLDADRFDATALMGPSQITDSYLLALAVNRDAVLVTLDTRLMLSTVTGAAQRHLHTLRTGENLR